VTFTFDTGMLIALERRRQAATDAFYAIVRRGFIPVVPAVARLAQHFPSVRVLGV
jgi:hypothetical protein